jgi:hypothetical protein
MKVIFDTIDHHTVSGIVATLRESMQETVERVFDLLDIDKQHPLPMPVNRQVCLYPRRTGIVDISLFSSTYFIAPLGSENDGHH